MVRIGIVFTLSISLLLKCEVAKHGIIAIDLQDSVLLQMPDCNIYYCDTFLSKRDSSSIEAIRSLDSNVISKPYNDYCINSFFIKRRKFDQYYIFEECNMDSSMISRDTFFITRSYRWYHYYNNQWQEYFSEKHFIDGTVTSIGHNVRGSASIENWIPDTVLNANKFGRLYVFDVNFPLSREAEYSKYYFSPYIGVVSYVNRYDGFTIAKIDTLNQ